MDSQLEFEIFRRESITLEQGIIWFYAWYSELILILILFFSIDWNMHHKQGVHFFVEKSEDVKINDVEVEVKFKQGELAFNFSVL